MERNLRDQSMDKDMLEAVGTITMYFFLSIIAIKCLACILTKNRGQCSYAIWQNIAFLQLIHWMNLINIDSHSEFEAFFKELSVIFRPLQVHNICFDNEISDSTFKAMKIKSNSFMNNTKEILIVYGAVMGFCLVITIGKYLSKEGKFDELFKVVKYSTLIRLHMVLFMDFMTFSMINIYFYSGSSACSTVNLILSIIFLTIGGLCILTIPLIIKKRISNNLDNHYDVVFRSIETLVAEFQPTFQTVTYQYYTIYLLYRLSVSFALVVLNKSSSVQLFVISSFQLILSKLYLVFFIFKARPFRRRVDLLTNFISETFTLILFIFIGIRTLDLDYERKYYLTIFSVVTIWLTEICICIRFALNIRQSSSKVNVFVTTNDSPAGDDNKISSKLGKINETGDVTGFINVRKDINQSNRGKINQSFDTDKINSRKFNLNDATTKTKTRVEATNTRRLFNSQSGHSDLNDFAKKIKK